MRCGAEILMGNRDRDSPRVGNVGNVPLCVWMVMEVFCPDKIWEMRSRPMSLAEEVAGW